VNSTIAMTIQTAIFENHGLFKPDSSKYAIDQTSTQWRQF